jgi:hypothetical protein
MALFRRYGGLGSKNKKEERETPTTNKARISSLYDKHLDKTRYIHSYLETTIQILPGPCEKHILCPQ